MPLRSIEQKLDDLVKKMILEKVEYSEWASLIVPVVKSDGSVMFCGDYKVTCNPHLEVDQYPLPKQEDLFVKLSGGKKFAKLGLSHAYNQVELEPTSKSIVTINTHFRPTHLVYGVSPVSPKDIWLYLALTWLAESGLRVKHEKCRFVQTSVTYLDYIINAQGGRADSSKVDTIKNAAAPKNVQELLSFLGCIKYYSKFIDKFSEIAFPLNLLFRKGQHWCWSDDCQNAFDQLKTQLASEQVLTHHDPKLPLKLDADASF